MIIGVGLLVIMLAFRIHNAPFNSLIIDGDREVQSRSGIIEIDLEERFDAQDYVGYGSPTIIEFCTSSCPGCHQLHSQYKEFLRMRPDIAVRQIIIPDNWSSNGIKNQYSVNIATTPHILIFNSDGDLVAKDEGKKKLGLKCLNKWMNKESKKDWERRQESTGK